MALVDRDISGHGSESFGNKQVSYVFVHLDSLGVNVNSPEPGVLDHILRAGWIAFGYNGDAGDGTIRDYWREPIWLNFVDTEWTPVPQYQGSDQTIWATQVRWWLSPGTTGHLWVNGY
jgi:hypothetical protein